MKQFDEWNSVKKEIEDYHRAPVKLGEIYWCRIGLNIGVEQDGKGDDFMRPVIIIKKFSDQIVDKTPAQEILNQIRPIDTKRLLSSLGQIGTTEVSKIINAYYEIIKK